jgi:hypothetical protein
LIIRVLLDNIAEKETANEEDPLYRKPDYQGPE